jgi:hypothetical protein
MDVYLDGFLVFDFTPPGMNPRNCSTCIGLESTTRPIAVNLWHSSPCFTLPE